MRDLVTNGNNASVLRANAIYWIYAYVLMETHIDSRLLYSLFFLFDNKKITKLRRKYLGIGFFVLAL